MVQIAPPTADDQASRFYRVTVHRRAHRPNLGADRPGGVDEWEETWEVELAANLHELVRLLGHRAVLNKCGRAMLGAGAVICRRRRCVATTQEPPAPEGGA